LYVTFYIAEAVQHEREISNMGRKELDFVERDKCKPVLLRLSLAGNLEKPLMYLYGAEWRERGYMDSGLSRPTTGLSCTQSKPAPLAHKHRPTSLLSPQATSADTHTETVSDNLVTFLRRKIILIEGKLV
jgi:hypothetical protein